jgi:Fe-S-cluster-containing hydrogenase component 2
VVCSLYHFGECNPERSAIRVVRKEKDGLVASLPLVCQQCEEALCMETCPTGALTRAEESGRVSVDKDLCSGCGECMEACPAGCIFMDNRNDVALCCDLCGGEPQCVPLCHSQSLTLAATGDAGTEDRVGVLSRIQEDESLFWRSIGSGAKR